jgi:hypothetical protein
MKLLKILSGSFCVLLLLVSQAHGQQGVGLIEKISGTVYLRSGGKQVQLDPRSDVARRLNAGEQIRCDSGGWVRLRVAGRLREISGPSGWFTIPRPGVAGADPIKKALDEYGRRGGRDRGAADLTVISPVDRGAVRRADFHISWLSAKNDCAVSFMLQNANGVEIWSQNNNAGKTGTVKSKELQQALLKLRDQDQPLLLTATDVCGNDARSSFAVLSNTQEKQLRTELARWNKEPGLFLRYIGRAEVFSRMLLFSDAAQEYEAALSAAPKSRELLLRTIAAQQRLGNWVREQELRQRLPDETEVQ